ncbi:MAG: outer membrane beta-barrel protein [Chitinophagaceae bacterium]|jgi:hypothetical protein
MKYLFLAVFGLMLSTTVGAQSNKDKKDGFAMPSRDYVMIQIGYDTWNSAPDSINITGIGRAFNAYICYDFPIQKSNFSFAAGLGIGTSNIYLKNQQVVLTDTTAFIQFVPETQDYKKYKISTAYVEAPFELRFFSNKENRNEGFKAALGLKVGALVGAHSKGKRTFNSKPIIEKVNTKRYLDTWRYAMTLRLGYGNFSVFGSYQLNSLFRAGSGPESIRPLQIGICLSGL